MQDVGVGDDDTQVDIDRGHEPALQLELPKLDRLQPDRAACVDFPPNFFSGVIAWMNSEF